MIHFPVNYKILPQVFLKETPNIIWLKGGLNTLLFVAK